MEKVNYLSAKDDWKRCQDNNLTITLNVLYAKNEKIYPHYIPEHNPNRQKQIILLVIPNREGWHYLTFKKLWTLLRDYYWWLFLFELSSFF